MNPEWPTPKPFVPYEKQPPKVVILRTARNQKCQQRLQRGPLICDIHRDQVERCDEFCHHHIGYILEPWPPKAAHTITMECIDEVSCETTYP